jgi:hypothetical protein
MNDQHKSPSWFVLSFDLAADSQNIFRTDTVGQGVGTGEDVAAAGRELAPPPRRFRSKPTRTSPCFLMNPGGK